MRRHLKQLDQMFNARQDQVTSTWKELQKCREKMESIEQERNSKMEQIEADKGNVALRQRLVGDYTLH